MISIISLPKVNVLSQRFSSALKVIYFHVKMNLKPDSKFQFDWKMTRPDAKKIIWAPHHMIDGEFSTFQWNYQFMYEFAKAHPEISWVVKPHPNLVHTAIGKKVFSSVQSYKDYFQKWDSLPNAKVYTGTYYQAIFATSDGMIQDCGSFIFEYQYVDKPMIYLLTGKENLNDLTKEIYLNYQKTNGMLASEFIYKNICDELKLPPR